MTSSDSDPAAIKTKQRADWNALSTAWEARRDEIERGGASLTTRLLELGGVGPGQTVLDVATGHGELALSAARLVGPTGRVLGVDISPAMIEVARKRASGLTNVDFVEADMEALGQAAGPFDVALSRFGLMFAVDHVGVFHTLARVITPGGVLAAAVWGPTSSHLLSKGPSALGQYLEMPPPAPGVPGPFSMSDQEQLTGELAAAGFREISVTEHVLPFEFASMEDYLSFNKAMLPPQMLQLLRDRFGSIDDADAWAVVARAVEPYEDQGGAIRLPSAALCLRAAT
jgi:SAM-dependent methyltransferase